MSMQRVAELVRRASRDTGVIAALRNDPSQLSKPLNLTEEDMNALQSASAFNAALAPKPKAKPLTQGLLATVGAVPPAAGVLLPPEGSGGGPAVLTLPPAVPVMQPAPDTVPAAVPVAPVAVPKVTPVVPAAPVSPPPAPPPAPPSMEAPVAPVEAHGGSPQTDHHETPGPTGDGTHNLPAPTGLPNLTSMVAGCEGDCSAAIVAVVASVSMAAQTALTALAAMAAE